MIAAVDMSGVIVPPGLRAHQLRGDCAETWSVSVTGNWRLTLHIRQRESAILRCRTTTDDRASAGIEMARQIRALLSTKKSSTNSA